MTTEVTTPEDFERATQMAGDVLREWPSKRVRSDEDELRTLARCYLAALSRLEAAEQQLAHNDTPVCEQCGGRPMPNGRCFDCGWPVGTQPEAVGLLSRRRAPGSWPMRPSLHSCPRIAARLRAHHPSSGNRSRLGDLPARRSRGCHHP